MGIGEMTDARRSMKQVQLKDVQENFGQIFEDVLMSGDPVKILKRRGMQYLFLKSSGVE